MAKSTNNAGNMKRATAKRTTTKTATTTRRAHRATKGKTAGGTAAKRITQRARQEGAPAARRLSPIGERETEAQILAAAAAETGIEERVGTLFNEAVMNRVTRHVVKGGSGNAPIPGLNAALFRGEQSARKAHTMFSPLLKREVTVPAKRAQAVPRLRAHQVLKEIVARA